MPVLYNYTLTCAELNCVRGRRGRERGREGRRERWKGIKEGERKKEERVFMCYVTGFILMRSHPRVSS